MKYRGLHADKFSFSSRQILALCITATNTFTTLLVNEGTSIPAFQTFFNYVFLNIIYTSFTIYRYGWKGYGRFLRRDGWKYIILSFLDVEGNYFTVLAYRYTTILSVSRPTPLVL
jgi:solute carrier family 35, member F1/2